MKKVYIYLCFGCLLLTPLSAQPLADGHEVFLGNIIGDPSHVPADFHSAMRPYQ